MKTYDEMTYDDQERFIDWVEAEYCPKCGGNGLVYVPNPLDWERQNFEPCDRCKGTGRA